MPRIQLPKRKADATCHYCGEPANSWDHVVPLSKKGPNRWWNRVPACRDCNEAKASRWPACPCDFCIRACEMYFEGRNHLSEVALVRSFNPEAELSPGLPIETIEQLQAWLRRGD